MLNINGFPSLKAASSASMQKSDVIVFESLQDSTKREYQSITATRYANPPLSGIYVISQLQT